ncbi:molybdenum cofactor guanylyltransferase MobA [uncultured Nitratireductor sp.]|uniref:molybdenum cofactor guanylyltransferase MobA n=1 Tax=uncultured Nitratireductor sp. TaxID=520953 RepID=UPI0025EB50EA|nr:molybdenum cofactor guanylyltransferase MobA [uncultured Nitratireductor sp.]
MNANNGIVGIILAGGAAERMGGGDKGMLPLNSKSLIETVRDRLSPQVDRIALNANGDPRRFAIFGLEVIADPLAERVGPLGGILAGLEWARRTVPSASHVVTAAADTPFFPRDLVSRLAAAMTGRPAVACSGGRVHPIFALWPVELADDLARHLARNGSRRVAAYACEMHSAALVEFPSEPDSDPFFNVNTPDDLLVARERHQREAP